MFRKSVWIINRFLFLVITLLGFCYCSSDHQVDGQWEIALTEPPTDEALSFRTTKIPTPDTIWVDESRLKKVRLGTPVVVPAPGNTIRAGVPHKWKSRAPQMAKPGEGPYLLPERILAVTRPVSAGKPKFIPARDMTFKTRNPACFTTFGKQHGLRNGIVSALAEDDNGNIWMGTIDGVTKYDGRSFSTYTTDEGLPHNDVRNLFKDSRGDIWFGTQGGGAARFDGLQFYHYGRQHGIGHDDVWKITEDLKGNIWFATYAGATRYDGKHFTRFTEKQGLISDTVACVFTGRSGDVWFCTGAGVSRFDGTTFYNYVLSEGSFSNMVYWGAEDKDGMIWFGTPEALIKFDGTYFYNYTKKEGKIVDESTLIMSDSRSQIWIGSAYGLSVFDGEKFTNYTDLDGLSNRIIYSLMEDKAGNIWIGTAGGGVSKFHKQGFTHFTEQEGLTKNYIFSVMEDTNGHMWFGSWRGGITRYNGTHFYQYRMAQGLPSEDFSQFVVDSAGHIWMGTPKGVCKYDGRVLTIFTTENGLVHDHILNMMIDRNGHLWLATEGGVSKYDGIRFINFTREDGLIHDQVDGITQDRQGNIWLGTKEGISKFDGLRFTNIGAQDGLTHPQVYSVLADANDHIWFATHGGGVLRYDGETFLTLNEKHGLLSDFVCSILQDRQGNIWFGTRFGLSKLPENKWKDLSKKALDDTEPGREIWFNNFTMADGFLGIGCNENSMMEAANGDIWIGTNTGVTTFTPQRTKEKAIAPVLSFTSVRLFNEAVDWKQHMQHQDTSFVLGNGVRVAGVRLKGLGKWEQVPEGLSLAHNNNFVTLEFVGATMHQPHNVRYQYKMDGIDPHWSRLTTQNSMSYANLKPGSYTFHLKSVNSEGQWSAPVSYSFTIRPAWWQAWWFRIASTVALIFFIFLIVRSFYLGQLRRQKMALEKQLAIEYERRRISADLHDDIGSSLSSINIYASLAKTDEHKDFHLDSISQNVREVVDKLDDLVWSINPKYDTLQNIADRLRAHAGNAAAAKGISLVIETDEAQKDKRPLAEARHQIYLVAKELINNALKHAGCTSLHVYFGGTAERMVIKVVDDGIGFDPDGVRKERNGLRNIQERVAAMRGSITFHSSPGKGTSAIMVIPS